MQIFTSSWFTPLPDSIQKIGISRGTPRGYPAGYRKLMALAPGSYFKTAEVREYKQLFFADLALLSPQRIVDQIGELANGRDCALLCYEAPAKDDHWCHRGYVSAWLHDTLRIEVFEHGMEQVGCGWYHPKIPRQYRLGAIC